MSNSGVPHAAERVVARLRRHGRVLLLPSIALLAVCGAAGFFTGRFPEDWQNLLVLAGAVVLIVVLFLFPLVAWLSTRYTITSRRVIVRRGMFVRERRELLHSRGYDVTVRRGWLQSIFRSGDVSVNTSLERPVVLCDVPRASLVQGALHDLIESAQIEAAQIGSAQGAASFPRSSAVADETAVWGHR